MSGSERTTAHQAQRAPNEERLTLGFFCLALARCVSLMSAVLRHIRRNEATLADLSALQQIQREIQGEFVALPVEERDRMRMAKDIMSDALHRLEQRLALKLQDPGTDIIRGQLKGGRQAESMSSSRGGTEWNQLHPRLAHELVAVVLCWTSDSVFADELEHMSVEEEAAADPTLDDARWMS